MIQLSQSFQSKLLPWLLFIFVSLFSIVGWLGIRQWSIGSISALTLFPLLGIYAWSIMWTHYIIGANRALHPYVAKNNNYSFISSIIVLLLILLHPGLLAWNMWVNFGMLPPGSIYSYAGESAKVLVMLGIISLTIFILFDIFSRLKNRAFVEHNWKWISLSQMLAMILIFIHGLGLGYILENSLFRFYWIALGLSLVPCFIILLKYEWTNKN